MICHCDEHSDKAIQPDGSPRLLSEVRDDARGMIVAETRTHHDPASATATRQQLADIWRVVVLNDPVNLMSYVVMVFKKVLGFDEMTARKHMLEVHEQGRSIVWSGVREKAEAYVFTLQQWHLTAVLETDESA
jgi:ATP-dependent Clp protease adaptor protein ClpS